MNALQDPETLARLIHRMPLDTMADHLVTAVLMAQRGAGSDVWESWRDELLDAAIHGAG